MSAGPTSPLELIHPRGVARRAAVVGSTCPDVLRPVSGTEGPYDLVVVVPPTGAAFGRWAVNTLRFLEGALEADGVAYVLAPWLGTRRLRRAIAASGLWIERELIHLPNRTSSLFVSSAERDPVRFVVGELMLVRGWKRRAAMIVGSRRRLALAAARPLGFGFVVRRRDSSPSFEWLSKLRGTATASVVVGRTRPTGAGYFVVHGFREGDGRPSVVAKVVPTGEATFDRELDALASVAVTARAAGADVPEVLGSGAIGDARVLLLEPLRGSLAATFLATSPRRLDDVLQRVACWLLHWGRLTTHPTRLTSSALEGWVLRPAHLVAGHIAGGPAYIARLERLCAEATGREIVTTAAHNDLTMWNVLLADPGKIGVIDWEEAGEPSLPLVDFYYAAADAVAATRAYADRALAFERVYGGESAVGLRIAEHESRLMNELGIDHQAAQLGFHACWLHHAANELSRTRGADAGPFARIIHSIAGMDDGRAASATRPRRL